MSQLSEMKCEPCRSGTLSMTDEAIAEYREQIPEWGVVKRDGVPQLERTFAFPDFRQALDFTNRVGELAEEQEHHPALFTEWGRVTVRWWTHAVKGLHRNDFVMAARTDRLTESL
ncbi:4a-hydroxytetrahydrobiopterin dehydratase [soil metagenome]|nr:4a-hydroxytetrahydrobiopterin dehydratase [Gemmatimonadota bacterium]